MTDNHQQGHPELATLEEANAVAYAACDVVAAELLAVRA